MESNTSGVGFQVVAVIEALEENIKITLENMSEPHLLSFHDLTWSLTPTVLAYSGSLSVN